MHVCTLLWEVITEVMWGGGYIDRQGWHSIYFRGMLLHFVPIISISQILYSTNTIMEFGYLLVN